MKLSEGISSKFKTGVTMWRCITKTDEEDCRKIVGTIMRKLNFLASSETTDVAHGKMSRGIIVRFTSQRARDEL